MNCPYRGSAPSSAGAAKPRKATARPNISSGPTTQFCKSDTASTRQSRKTSPSSSYFTFASGGYIITISPSAMGMFVVPIDSRLTADSAPGTA